MAAGFAGLGPEWITRRQRSSDSPRGARVTTLTRSKLACAFCAAVAVYGMFTSRPAAVTTAVAPRGGLPIQFRRPLRVAAESVGISKQELVERILAARS